MKKCVFFMTLFLFTGCSYKISDVNISGKNKECVRECTKSHSSCVSAGNQIGFKTETLRACKDTFEICVSTCD